MHVCIWVHFPIVHSLDNQGQIECSEFQFISKSVMSIDITDFMQLNDYKPDIIPLFGYFVQLRQLRLSHSTHLQILRKSCGFYLHLS